MIVHLLPSRKTCRGEATKGSILRGLSVASNESQLGKEGLIPVVWRKRTRVVVYTQEMAACHYLPQKYSKVRCLGHNVTHTSSFFPFPCLDMMLFV